MKKNSVSRTSRASASAFAKWVFEKLHPNLTYSAQNDIITHRRLDLGKMAHDEIELLLRTKWITAIFDGRPMSDWRLVFADTAESTHQPFLANSLKIGDRSLRCIPDVVFFNDKSKDYLIVERKTTYVPSAFQSKNGWLNIEAQLWCYSMIDDFLDARDVILVAQIWARDRGALVMSHNHPFWKRSDFDHHRRCAALFTEYGGTILPLNVQFNASQARDKSSQASRSAYIPPKRRKEILETVVNRYEHYKKTPSNDRSPIWLRLKCMTCSREGRYKLTSLEEKFGPNRQMEKIIEELAHCPKWTSNCCDIEYLID